MNRRRVTRLRVERLEDRRLLDAVGFGDPVDPVEAVDADLPAEMLADDELGWSGYLGGSQSDRARAVAVDGQGNAWVTGWTESAGWVSGGSDTSFGGDSDAFVAKISQDGKLLWTTYLGGSARDEGLGIAVDAAGNAWVTGGTNSAGWAFGGFDTEPNGGRDAFLAKIDDSGNILWVTYLGGSVNDEGRDVAVDAAGNAWVTGWTRSPDWVVGGFDVTFDGGPYDAFVAGVGSDGQLLWSSYLGGDNEDVGFSIDVDVAGDLWLTGRTASIGWVADGFDTTFGGGQYDAMVAKITTGAALLWSAYLGGNARDGGTAIALDPAGNAWVTGWTDSEGWVAGGANSIPGGGIDAFAGLIGADGRLLWTTYLGGEEGDQGLSVAADAAGNGWVVGMTASADWIADGADLQLDGPHDAFVAELDPAGQIVHSSYLGGNLSEWGYGVAADMLGNVWITGETNSAEWVLGGLDETYHGGTWDAYVAKLPIGGISTDPFIRGRYVFYNASAFDGNDTAADARDDDAIAVDKRALLPGRAASFANYTSYTRGINGVMVDVANLLEGVIPSADDFVFRVGNNSTPDDWLPVAVPATVTVRENAGVGGSDRVTIAWPNGAVRNQWLEVTVAAARLGMTADDVFYFGNAVGEAGDSVSPALVTAADLLVARNNPRIFLDPAPVDFVCDFNRDTFVNAVDVLIARNNQTDFMTGLQLIDLPGAKTGGDEAAELRRAEAAWLYDLQQTHPKRRVELAGDGAPRAVDLLLQ